MSKDLHAKDAREISEEVKRIILGLKASPQKIRLNVPRHLVTARFLRIPSTDDIEIGKIMNIESIKHLPYTDEKVIYGYRVTEKMDDGYSLVLLAVAQSGIINSLIGIINDAGIGGLDSVSLSSEGLFLWYMAASPDPGGCNVMLVNLESNHADIDIIERGRLVFTRGVAFANNDQKKADRIASELSASINTYLKDPSKTVDRVMLTGGRNAVSEFYPSIEKGSRVPVETIDQSENMPLDAGVVPSEDASFAELMGSALASDEVRINLIPEEALAGSRLISVKKNLLTALGLSGVIAILILGIFVKKLHDNSMYSAVINGELKKIESKVSEAKRMTKDINTIRQAMARRPLAIDVVSEIYGVTPEGISLSMIDYEAAKSVSVRGTAPSLGEAFKYVGILENSPLFEGVKVKYANKRTVENKESVDFEITAVPAALK